MKQDDFDKIERYIKGVADDNEKKYVESLFLNEESNLYFRNRLEEDWELMLKDDIDTKIDLRHLLDHIHHIINKNEIEKRNKPLRKIVLVYMRTAAILLVPLMVAGGLIYSYMSNRYKTVTGEETTSVIFAPLGSRVSFNLPDGTIGMLNSGSHLSYSIPFANDRHIKLEGEAWFKVKHDEKHPFEINAGNSEVKVLGTTFNISAYPTENYIEVVLQEGKVEFLEDKRDEVITLLPSERLIFRNGKISKSVVDPGKYNAWTEGELVFRGDPMAEVVRRIERWYNVKIKLAGQDIEKYSFRATFQDDKLEDVLRFLAMTSPIEYTITPSELMPDGTVKKEVITIFKKNH